MLKLDLPFRYISVSQKWGNPNAAYEQFGFKQHNGVDLICGYANANAAYAPSKWPVYCPVERFTVHMQRYSPNGGGHEFWLLSDEEYEIDGVMCHVYLGFAHAHKVFVKVGDKPKLGEMLSVQDSTGFSTGPHLHLGMYRVKWDGKLMTFLDKNEANGSYDVSKFFTKEYAVDKATLQTLIKSNLRYATWFIGG